MHIFVILLAAAAAITAGFLATSASPYIVLVLTGCVLVAVFAFLSPKLSLVLLLVSMLFSPEIGLGTVAGGRNVVLRYDDLLIVIIFLAWFARTAIFKHKPFITETPVQTPILVYTLLAIVSTSFGILRGDVKFITSFFYILKYVEYFLIYFMTVNVLDSKEEMKKYLKYGVLVAIGVTVYAYYYYYSSGPGARATAPFEAAIGKVGESEPASLGGYYLIVLGVLIAMLTEYSGRALLLALSLIAFIIPAFLLTFSRSSYIGFSFMVLFMLLFSSRRKFFLAFVLLAGVLAASFAPDMIGKVRERVTMTYQGVYATSAVNLGGVGNVRIEESAAQRVRSLNRVLFEKLPKHPLLGWGVTGVGLGDTQYALVLGETGILGLFAFVWMLTRLFSTAAAVYKKSAEPWIRVVAFGFIASLIALLFQSVGVNSFIITRIMEPFWFLAALIMVLHRGLEQKVKPKPAKAA